LYSQVANPILASYGYSHYIVAITQLAQTTLRSVIGNKAFEDRNIISSQVVAAIDEAARNWGVKSVPSLRLLKAVDKRKST
jgi:regulator of protease activity HflC (stomatin/prohibitin superfamily)